MPEIDNGAGLKGLHGIRILDFTWAGAGPFATEQLCRLGADVVKVEAASRPDLLRVANIAYNWGPGGLESNSCFNDMNAGKRSISLDLKTQEGRDIALRLAKEADVVCDNMRPGKMEALGLGYEHLRKVNPRIISCSVSATGRVTMLDGTAQPDMPGYAPVFWAEGGGASVTGFPGGEPAYFRAPVDMNAATYVAIGVMAALIARDQTGKGCHVDCSAVESVTACVGDEVLASSLGLAAGGLRGNERPPYFINDTFPCAGEDRWIAISVESDEDWARLCQVLELRHLKDDAELVRRYERGAAREELYNAIGEATRDKEGAALEAKLQAAGIAAVFCAPLEDLLSDQGLTQRGYWRTVEHPVIGTQRIGGLAYNITPPIPHTDRCGPLLGEHTAEVLSHWLGMGMAEMEALHAAGAFEKIKL